MFCGVAGILLGGRGVEAGGPPTASGGVTDVPPLGAMFIGDSGRCSEGSGDSRPLPAGEAPARRGSCGGSGCAGAATELLVMEVKMAGGEGRCSEGAPGGGPERPAHTLVTEAIEGGCCPRRGAG
uniref:Uncharacterized protein n=1 Tax=Alexandrium monilatum TaxID=311494 RepID=A0A6T0WV72_9DINO